MSKLQEAKDKGIDLTTDGLDISNKVGFTETWADGYVRKGEAEAGTYEGTSSLFRAGRLFIKEV